MSVLEFRPIELDDVRKIYPYTSKYGENSCQNSAVSMYSLFGKYGEHYAIDNDLLYILRTGLCSDEYRVYLAPMGENIKEGFMRLIKDAHIHDKKASFHTLTQRSAEILEQACPGRFEIEERPDMGEYIYDVEKLSTYPGKQLKVHRRLVHKFWRTYEERLTMNTIGQEDLSEILEFAKSWLSERSSSEGIDPAEVASISGEFEAIRRQTADFFALDLSGIVIRMDGKVCGFAYGTSLNDGCYDGIIEKGDLSIPAINKVLTQEIAKQCANEHRYFNMEEDLGLPGLRTVKLYYDPVTILKKYTAKEK
ncbi:MAG: phosphatidylglycerol lysyltransferase domain-containing protein [Lachnospiraceae bacterium]|nr:phosphatidylglycerol lysyltransferase domain-containing protein [Lachnospiraceae bacterium]